MPWVYLVIALVGVAFTQIRFSVRVRTLVVSLLVSAMITGGLWFAVSPERVWSLYALYVWSGIFATLSVVQLWIFIGASFTSGEGKRLFGLIGMGGIVGAIVGSIAARLIADVTPARALVPAGAAVMIVAAFSVIATSRALRGVGRALQKPAAGQKEKAAETGSVWSLIGHRYIRSLGLFILVATFALTIADYLFKSIVASEISDANELSAFFATFYAVTNIAALLVQLAITPLVLRYLGLGAALVTLPLLLFGATGGVVLGGGLIAASAMRGVDGGLRHSLFRTAIEVLYLPLASRVRARAKLLVDIAGQRGGQALGSITILLVALLFADSRLIAAVIATVAFAFAVVLAFAVRRENLAMFRAALGEESLQTRIEFPELDVSSLEVLVSKLSSLDAAEVRATIRVLDETGQSSSVPTLVLFHPEPSVVLTALALFRRDGRADLEPVARHLLGQPNSEVRAAALLTLDGLGHSTDVPNHRGDTWLAAADAVIAIKRGRLSEPLDKFLEKFRSRPDADLALARAAAFSSSPDLVPLLAVLSDTSDSEARRALVNAARGLGTRELIEPFLPLLAERAVRDSVRLLYVEIGQPALRVCALALADVATPHSIRRHLPRTISRFDPKQAVPIMLSALRKEQDDVVAYKLLRGLGRLRAEDPRLKLDIESLRELRAVVVERAGRLLRWRHALKTAPSSEALNLLERLIASRHTRFLEVFFRLVGLEHPSEELEEIYRGVESDDRRTRDSGRQLLTGLLDRSEQPVLIFLDDRSVEEKLIALGFTDELTVDAALEEIREQATGPVRDIARELDLGELILSSKEAAQ